MPRPLVTPTVVAAMFLVSALLVGSASAQSAVSMGQMLKDVRAQSPTVAAATARITAVRREWDAAGKPGDPMLSIELDNVGFMEDSPGPMLMYMLEQPLPIFGTLGLEERVVDRARERTEADLATVQRDLEGTTARAYVMLWRAQNELSVLELQRRLLEDMGAAALARMATGADTHHDVIQSQVEALSLQNQQTRIAAERTAAIAMLNALRNRPGAEEFAAAPDLPAVSDPGSLAALEQEALRNRPELRSMAAMAEEERAMAELMRRERWPMLSVGAFYNHELEMEDSIGFVLRSTLPVFGASRQSARAAASEARASAVQSDRSAMALMIRAELRSVLATFRAANERVSLLADVALPRAEQALTQAQSSYRTAMMPFASVIQDQSMLTMLRMELIAAQAERFEAFIIVMRTLGRDLTGAVSP